MQTELAVIGGGPAGVAAATMAASLGLDVVLVDEAADAGGQVYRAPDSGARAAGAGGPDLEAGDRLRAELKASGVRALFGQRVWHVDAQRTIATLGPAGALTLQPRAVIVAAGATERTYPFQGWTLPGVVGLAAATIMLKAHKLLPGRRVLVAGPGPLGPLVANGLRAGGAEVVALLDPNPLAAWLREAPAMAARPDLAWRGARWLTGLRTGGVPVLHGWGIAAVEARGDELAVTACRVDLEWRPVEGGERRTFIVDAVCAGHGLQPSTELVQLFGADAVYDASSGGWTPRLDADGRTTAPAIYAAGDGAGLKGAAAATHSGRLAALTAALDLGRLDQDAWRTAANRERRALARESRFGSAMARLMAPRSGPLADMADDVVVCRCEDVTAGALRDTIRSGVASLNALKFATRCGMGPCGGRVCAAAAGALMENEGCNPAAIGQMTARSPLRPAPMDRLVSDFDYADIPLPEPAPA